MLTLVWKNVVDNMSIYTFISVEYTAWFITIFHILNFNNGCCERSIRLFNKSRPMLIVYMGGIGDYLLLEHSMNLNSANLPEKIDLAYVPSRLKGIPELNPRIDRVFYLNFLDKKQLSVLKVRWYK